MNKKILIASDHGGFKLKRKLIEFLTKKGHNVTDLGAYEYNSKDDYPDYAKKLTRKIKNDLGILICRTGQGMCITVNKFSGIRAALVWDAKSAKDAKEHLNANVICIGGDRTKEDAAKKIVISWLNSKFLKGRHLRRIKKIR